MRFAIVLLFQALYHASLAAPIQRTSYQKYTSSPVGNPKDSPICYHRWRHHGHLTFRLARLESCGAWTVQQTTTTNMDNPIGEPQSCSRPYRALVEHSWTG